MTTATAAKPNRRFLRFSLRTSLLVMLVVCVTLGWKVHRARKQRETVAWVQECGGKIRYDYELVDARRPLFNPKPPGPKWLRELLGIGGTPVSDVTAHRRFEFHKRSHDGSAKADAAFTASSNDRVWGVVYQLHYTM